MVALGDCHRDGVSAFSAHFNRYYLGVAIDVGINIILAVSLNLINGHTGQFSLGHAGFMAVGAYTCRQVLADVSTAISPVAAAVRLRGRFAAGRIDGGGGRTGGGRALAAVARGLSGHRHSGIRRNHPRHSTRTCESFGAATGLTGIPNWTTFGWAWSAAAITVFVVTCLVNSTYGRGLHRRA